jgi:hypothetical protein
MADIEKAILQDLGTKGAVEDSGELAIRLGQDHLAVVGVLKSLEAAEMITMQVGLPAGYHPAPAHCWCAPGVLQPGHVCVAGHKPPAVCSDRRVQELRGGWIT